MDWSSREALPQRRARRKPERQEATQPQERTDVESGVDHFDELTVTDQREPQGSIERGQDGRELLRSAAEAGASYEYLDHTADVQLHAWIAMLNYMTPLNDVDTDESCARSFSAEGHDMHSLLFSFLDELLFLFLTEFVVLKELKVNKLDKATWTLEASGRGFVFDRKVHACGTEVKAITYSAMQVNEKTAQGDVETFVVVDI